MVSPVFGGSKSEGVKPGGRMTVQGGGLSGSGGGGDSAEDRSNAGYGPTGSPRTYPKGGATPSNTQSAPFNPQKQPAVDFAVGGVD